mmetsp:Transcript_108179/g.279769  ORF Transcript_108179/g.279769 Transcript_108179/m.279769 type:complete len:507 (-) Transcript_108179:68-1588(-)
MLNMNSVAHQHLLHEPVYKLCDWVNASQSLVQCGAVACGSQQPWVGWGGFTRCKDTRVPIRRKDPAHLQLCGVIQLERMKDRTRICHESAPLLAADRQMLVRLLHRPTRVALRPTCKIPHDLRDQELEAVRLLRLVPLRDPRIGVELGVRHPLVHQGIGQACQAEDASAAAVKCARVAKNTLAGSDQGPGSRMPRGNCFLAQHPACCRGTDVLHCGCDVKPCRIWLRLCGRGIHDMVLVRLQHLQQAPSSRSGKVVGSNLGSCDEDAPRGLRHEQLGLVVISGCHHLGATANTAHKLREEVLQRSLVALLRVHREAHTLVVKQGIHHPVDEESDGVDSANPRVQRAPRGPSRAGIPRDVFPGIHHAVHLHRDHQGIEVVDHLRGETELAADLVEDLHEDAPLVLADVEVLVRHVYRPAGVHLWSARKVAHDLHHEKLESAPLGLLVPCRNGLVFVQRGVCHPLVHASVHEGGDAEDAPTLGIQRPEVAIHPGKGFTAEGRLHPAYG